MSSRIGMIANCFVWAALLAVPSLLVASEPPNVLLIIGDDISYRDYGFMGAKPVDTPHLDQLAREGMTYTRGYVPTSLCRASLMSIVSGLYPHQHGVVGNDPPKGEDRAKMLWAIRKHPTIPKLLAPKGYYSFQTGKWWEGAATEGGFTAGMTHGDPSKGGRHGDEGLKIGRATMQPIEAAIVTAKKEKKPFFIWYAPMLPHTPHDPPADLLAKYKLKTESAPLAKYWANIERFDRTIGELRKTLADQQVAENTFIVYLHDNGWIQDLKESKFAPRSKRSPYEGGVRTPLILHWPGKIAPARNEQSLVSSLDIAPTILARARIPPTTNMPGQDVAPITSGAPQERKAIFGASFSHDVGSLTSPAKGLENRWCVTRDRKFILDEKTGRVELFDLKNDPDESKDLAGLHPEMAIEFRQLLDSWWDGKQVATETSAEELKKP